MIRAQVSALLTSAALYDRRAVGDADVSAWFPFMEGIDFSAAQRAVFAHYGETRDWLTPHDVIRRVRDERNQRIADRDFAYVPSDPDEPPEVYLSRLRAQLSVVADGHELPAIAHAIRPRPRPLAELISGLAPGTAIPAAIREVVARRRHPALGLSCPACRAPGGSVCQNGAGRPLERRTHPSRVDAWAVVTTPCPECRAPAASGCLELGQPYPHGAHRARVEAAGGDS